jgi:hypothetical protein
MACHAGRAFPDRQNAEAADVLDSKSVKANYLA